MGVLLVARSQSQPCVFICTELGSTFIIVDSNYTVSGVIIMYHQCFHFT